MIQIAEWPEEYNNNLKDLVEQLKDEGWLNWFGEGDIMAWRRPTENARSAHP